MKWRGGTHSFSSTLVPYLGPDWRGAVRLQAVLVQQNRSAVYRLDADTKRFSNTSEKINDGSIDNETCYCLMNGQHY